LDTPASGELITSNTAEPDGRKRLEVEASKTGQAGPTNFDDVDALTEVARAWNLEFTQLDRGGFSGALAQAVADDLNVAWARFDIGIEQRGSTPAELITFAVPAIPSFRIHWRGQEVSGRHLMRFPRSRELYSISRPGFEVLTISVPESTLATTADELRLRDVDREVSEIPAAALEEVRRAARRALREPASAAPEVCAALLRAQAAAGPEPGSPRPATRHGALRRALDFVDANLKSPLTVRDLCLAADCSERTIRRVFEEHFGVRPKSYLRSRRLAGVRRELLRSTPEEGVVHVLAGRWGFWHMGQFARDYRLQFGELPSESLARVAR
jgi:AraC family ethanolamine operon transcriptional activator